MKRCWRLAAFVLMGLFLLTTTQPVQGQSQDPGPVVRGVLFYSPSCGHCEYVITQVLPPLLEQYGEQLQIIGIDVSNESGSILFKYTLQKFGLQSGGVPFLVIGDVYLVGSQEIPQKLPGMIEDLLAQGGVDWPNITGLDQALEAANLAESETTNPPSQEQVNVPAPAQDEESAQLLPDLAARLNQDPQGNALSILVLAGMVVSVVWVALNFWRIRGPSLPQNLNWIFPGLCILGIGISVYLGYVETANVEAVCGPVGDCNTVQQSQYAILFDVLPVGVLGVIGNVAILAAWTVNRYGIKKWADWAAVAQLAMSMFGLLFSIYLTFLEPFVIGATCIWCLSSAVIMTALFWLGLPEGTKAVNRLLKPQRRATKVSPPAL